MACFTIPNVKLVGISACVPEKVISNLDHPYFSTEQMTPFVNSTGVNQRYIATEEQTTADLCYKAAEDLIAKLGWEKSEIDLLILVTQTADYKLPVTSAILQDRLNLPTTCLAMDIPLGCSGYVYGVSTIASLINAGAARKGLLLVGETNSKVVSPFDKSTEPLFGDAGTASAFEFDANAVPIPFSLGTDGSGYKAIIIPAGGARTKTDETSLKFEQVEDGINRNQCSLVMDGMDVFSFGISRAPSAVRELLEYTNKETEEIDYFVFHQANLFMNKKIVKKLKIPEEKVPYTLDKYGNTSSATIPLTIVSELKDKLSSGRHQTLCCGFGVGLSWGTMVLNTENLIVTDITQI
ncbi:ketoacyl-ACP synthase III [Pedobacter sp. BG31]|uniref:ketoacyl-ACP synthase III n=1 Tax=Pedobacter sp. BG31 TaxID=3349697 RepID=UPI0011A7A9B8